MAAVVGRLLLRQQTLHAARRWEALGYSVHARFGRYPRPASVAGFSPEVRAAQGSREVLVLIEAPGAGSLLALLRKEAICRWVFEQSGRSAHFLLTFAPSIGARRRRHPRHPPA